MNHPRLCPDFLSHDLAFSHFAAQRLDGKGNSGHRGVTPNQGFHLLWVQAATDILEVAGNHLGEITSSEPLVLQALCPCQ